MIDFGLGCKLDVIKQVDLMRMLRWRNDYKIWEYCRQFDLISWENHEKWFNSLKDNPKIRMYSIVNDDGLVGVCGLTDIDHINRRAEFSLYIGPEFQGRGYASKGLRTLFNHGFQNLNLNCIWGETFVGNKADKLFEQIGMKLEGSRREFYFRSGKYIDAKLYSVLASEWEMRLQVS